MSGPTYENAPLNEVVISASVQPVLELAAQHVGILWSQLRDQYPTCEQHPPVGTLLEAPGDFMPLGRFWFISRDETDVFQLQRDRFTVNWRRRGNLQYPRFDAVRQRFEQCHRCLRQFVEGELRTELSKLLTMELTYVNTIGPEMGWRGIESLSEVFPALSPPHLGGDVNLANVHLTLVAENAKSDHTVLVTVRNGIQQTSGEPTLIFEIKINSGASERDEAESSEWLMAAHDCVLNTFQALTSKKVQDEVWLRVLKDA
jgi:uncharacterized protein (TIGR04255 family)